MVAQNTVRTYEVNQIFRFVEGIWFISIEIERDVKSDFFARKGIYITLHRPDDRPLYCIMFVLIIS